MVRSERAGVARQGQDKPDGDQTFDVISASGEEIGNRELAGVHTTVVDRNQTRYALGRGTSDATRIHGICVVNNCDIEGILR